MDKTTYETALQHLPLKGVKVLDLSRVLTGPYCTMLLADLGAEVIKVERKEVGDDTRHWGPPFVGETNESAYFICANRNKKSLTIDMKNEEGLRLIYDLVKQCDVVVENFRVGVVKKLKLDYETLREINPRLIYASITGFGQTGPKKDYPGYDFVIQGMGGIMSITGEPTGAPMKVGVAIDDIVAGLFATIAINSALYRREHTGLGDYIDVSLLDSQVAWLANIGSSYLLTKKLPYRYGNAHASIVPYQAFKASDQYFIICVGNNEQWKRLCNAIGQPELGDDLRFATNPVRVENREKVVKILSEAFEKETADYWVDALFKAGVPAGPINDLGQVFSDPQVRHREMVVKAFHPSVGDEIEMVGNPIKLAQTEPMAFVAPPLLGQHVDSILESFGYTREKIEELKAKNVI